MSKKKHHHPDSEGESVGFHRPYWKHAHKDWRLWIAVGLMLVAMFIYIASGDLVWRPNPYAAQPGSSAAQK